MQHEIAVTSTKHSVIQYINYMEKKENKISIKMRSSWETPSKQPSLRMPRIPWRSKRIKRQGIRWTIDLLERCRIVKRKKTSVQRCWSQFESRKKVWGAVRFEICDLILNPVYPCNLTFTVEITAVNCSRGVSDYARLYIIILRTYFIRMSRLKSAKF